ncbi:MAG: glycosyltransferase [Nanoarchaeota archaeon]|nr:glycosyltransferase family 2 protein [Nanoarchaeota archaeon]MBU1029992.1 glycosyltransferase family 2 protein [Nanoarchaeota archaeon]
MITLANIILWIIYFISLYFVVFWLLVFFENEDIVGPKKKSTKFPLVSVILPAHNEEKTIIPSVKSVLSLNYPKDKLEIIIIDDGSTDNTKKMVLEFIKNYPKIKFISHENIGKGASLNKALKICKGEFFICLDADSFVHKDALLHLIPNFNDKSVACALPLMKASKPKNILQKIQFSEYLVNIFYKKLMGFLHCIPVAPGPFSIYRKSVLLKLGGYDENNLTEDLEMTLKLQKNHYKIVQDMHAQVFTNTPANIKAFFRQRKRWYKGGLFNGIKYRRLMFNPKYGDFGIIQLPMLILSGIIGISIIFTTLYTGLKPHVQNLLNLRYVNFDFFTFLKDLSFSFTFLDLNFNTFFIFICMLFISIFVLYLSYTFSNEKVFNQGKIHIALFLFFYFLMLGVSWILLLPEVIFHKKHVW